MQPLPQSLKGGRSQEKIISEEFLNTLFKLIFFNLQGKHLKCLHRPGQSCLELFFLLSQLGTELSNLGLQLRNLIACLSKVTLHLASVLLQLLTLLLLPAQTVWQKKERKKKKKNLITGMEGKKDAVLHTSCMMLSATFGFSSHPPSL